MLDRQEEDIDMEDRFENYKFENLMNLLDGFICDKQLEDEFNEFCIKCFEEEIDEKKECQADLIRKYVDIDMEN